MFARVSTAFRNRTAFRHQVKLHAPLSVTIARRALANTE